MTRRKVTDRKVDIKIRIGEYPLELRVGLSEQDRVREVENAVNALYAKWHERFSSKTDMELLAMLTYQYASFYFAMCDREKQLTDMIRELYGNVETALGEPTPAKKRSNEVNT